MGAKSMNIEGAVLSASMLDVIRTWQSGIDGEIQDHPVTWAMDALETLTDCVIEPDHVREMSDKDKMELLYMIRSLKKELSVFRNI